MWYSESGTLQNGLSESPRQAQFPLTEHQRLRRHKFNVQIKRRLRKLSIYDNFHGLLAAVEDFIVIAVSIAVGTFVPIVSPIAIFTIGSRMRALATLLHEASHQTLARNPILNRVIGTIAGYLIFQSFESYKKSHVTEHHPYTGNPNFDPDLKFHINAGLYDRLAPNQFLWRHIIRPGLGLNVGQNVSYLLRNRMLGVFRKDASVNSRKDASMFIAFWIGVMATLTTTDLWVPFLFWWILPYLTTFQIVNYFCELGEHFPQPAITTLDISASRNRLGNAVERFFFGMHNEHLHLEHHLAPSIPFWNLPKAREARLQDPTYAALDADAGGLFTRGPNGATSIIAQIMKWIASNTENDHANKEICGSR